jgi:hypothetical protein
MAELEMAEKTLVRYFKALDNFDIDVLIDTLNEEVDFGHPQVPDWQPDAAIPRLRGRENVRRFMLEFRKKQDSEHRLTGFARGSIVTGPNVEGSDFYIGAVTGRNGVYITSCLIIFETDDEHRISRYSPHVAPPSYNHQTPLDYLMRFTPGVGAGQVHIGMDSP